MRWRWWYAAIPALGLLAGCTSHGGAATADDEAEKEKDEAHVTVRTEPARLAAMTAAVDGLGRCEALPDHIAHLTPAVEGHVHDLLVAQGDAVKHGQPIVELDRAVALADLAEKTATRDGLEASLKLLRSIPRPAERRASELAVEQAKLAVEQAQVSLERLQSLLKNHQMPESQVRDAERVVKQAAIQQQTAEAQLAVMMIGPRPEAVAEAEGKIKTADALVAFSRAHLDYHTIRSPIEGVLDSLTCRPGQTIAIGGPIGEVVDSRQVFASVWLPPRSATSVRVGQDARVRPADANRHAAETAGADQRMAGKVAFVGRVTDPQTGNLPIRVLVDNPEGRLTIGQSIRVEIVAGRRDSVLQVPASAIMDLGEGPVLPIVREGKAALLHPEVGASHDGWAEVSGTDLKPGEPVIVEGGYNLPEKTPVLVAGEEKAEHAKADDEKAEHAKADDAKAGHAEEKP